MKKVLACLLMCTIGQAYATDSITFRGETFQCNKVYKSRPLRANYSYSLKLQFYNNSDTEVILGDYKVNLNGGNYGLVDPKYGWTDWIKSKKGIIKPKETGEILESSEYQVVRIPEKRASDNLLIRYTNQYKVVSNGKPVGFSKSYISCQLYEISWCGDGVLDEEYQEICDPNDPNKQGWGVGGCNPKTCKPFDSVTYSSSQLFPKSTFGRHEKTQMSLIQLINHQG